MCVGAAAANVRKNAVIAGENAYDGPTAPRRPRDCRAALNDGGQSARREGRHEVALRRGLALGIARARPALLARGMAGDRRHDARLNFERRIDKGLMP